MRLRTPKQRLIVAAYQARLFNAWLAKRVEISRTIASCDIAQASRRLDFPEALIEALRAQNAFFKLFLGDIVSIKEKFVYVRNLKAASEAFAKREAIPTGLLCGYATLRAKSDARVLEAPYDDKEIDRLRGDRRAAWVWPQAFQSTYDAQAKRMRLRFRLPKGAYATTFLEHIANRSLKSVR